MKIKGYPILHARTYNVDFRSRLLVSPPDSFFSERDSEFCYKLASDSTRFRELAPKEGRIVIYGNGSACVIGKMAVFSDLYSICNLPPKYIHVDRENGRLAYGFVGIAFELKDIDRPVILSDRTLLKIYEKCIERRWEETYEAENVFESSISDFVELDMDVMELPPNDRGIEQALKYRRTKLAIDDTEENRNSLIYYAIKSIAGRENLAICTSLYSRKALEESNFDVATCEDASVSISEIVDNSDECHTLASKQNKSQFSKAEQSRRKFLDDLTPPKNEETICFGKSELLGGISNAIEDFVNKASRQKGCPQKKEEKELSFKEMIEQNSVPDDEWKGFHTSFPRFGKKESKNSNNRMSKSENDYKGAGLLLGTVMGVSFIAIEISKKASTAVLAITGTCTVLLGTAAAKHILKKYLK